MFSCLRQKHFNQHSLNQGVQIFNQRLGQHGQVAVEFVLVATLLVTLALGAMKLIRSEQLVDNMIAKPWTILAGMIENGNWGPSAKTVTQHPGFLERHISLKGVPKR